MNIVLATANQSTLPFQITWPVLRGKILSPILDLCCMLAHHQEEKIELGKDNLIHLDSYPVKPVLDRLLKDKTTGNNIIWATRSYEEYGECYTDEHEITRDALLGMNPILIQPRVLKALEEQQERTKGKAEVFTPSWICNKMNNVCDEEWFGRKDVFNIESEDGTSWTATTTSIEFPDEKTWKDYVRSTRLEITCGEAPFLVSRYDATTGEVIPIRERIGQLDRKLRVINENVKDEKEWIEAAYDAFRASYGYEFQGDSLLIARINMLITFVEYVQNRWNRLPSIREIEKVANIIAWNVWQMDGLTGTVPLGVPKPEVEQLDMFAMIGQSEEEKHNEAPICRVYNWRSNRSEPYKQLSGDLK